MTNIQQIKLRRRIIKNINKEPNGCWIWKRRSRKQGYAQITYQVDGRTKHTSPHRLAYVLFRNRPDLLTDKKLLVCHKCDHKDCINPEHMFVGDWLENAMDDVLRNPKVSLAFMKKIELMYRERYGLGPNIRITKLLGKF